MSQQISLEEQYKAVNLRRLHHELERLEKLEAELLKQQQRSTHWEEEHQEDIYKSQVFFDEEHEKQTNAESKRIKLEIIRLESLKRDLKHYNDQNHSHQKEPDQWCIDDDRIESARVRREEKEEVLKKLRKEKVFRPTGLSKKISGVDHAEAVCARREELDAEGERKGEELLGSLAKRFVRAAEVVGDRNDEVIARAHVSVLDSVAGHSRHELYDKLDDVKHLLEFDEERHHEEEVEERHLEFLDKVKERQKHLQTFK